MERSNNRSNCSNSTFYLFIVKPMIGWSGDRLTSAHWLIKTGDRVFRCTSRRQTSQWDDLKRFSLIVNLCNRTRPCPHANICPLSSVTWLQYIYLTINSESVTNEVTRVLSLKDDLKLQWLLHWIITVTWPQLPQQVNQNTTGGVRV